MEFAIKINGQYLHRFEVNSGYCGHSTVNGNEVTQAVLQNESYWFDCISVGNKVKELLELMRWRDIDMTEVKIIPREDR